MLTGAWADVDDVVGHPDGVLVVLDHQDGVAEVADPIIVSMSRWLSLVQPDRRLVEHVEHADEPRADLRGEPDAPRLAAGEGARRTGQRRVVEADVEEEAHTGIDLLDDASAMRWSLGQLQLPEELGRLPDAQIADVGDRATADRHRQAERLQALAAARRAGTSRIQPSICSRIESDSASECRRWR